MVAIVGGNGLGLFNTTSGGGQSRIGAGNDRAYVNASTGNLVLQSQDDYLAALGLDLAAVRTYNSLGLANDDNGDKWQMSFYCRLYNLPSSGTGDITRENGDGHRATFVYDTGKGYWLSSDGDGAHDTLKKSGSTWIYEDTSAGLTEVYDADGKITTFKNRDGLLTTLHYDANGLIDLITDSSNNTTELHYTGNNLDYLKVNWTNGTLSGQEIRVRYGYDSYNRLNKVTVDLSAIGDSTVDGNSDIYVTEYEYVDTTSRLISRVVESAYDDASSSFKVNSELLIGYEASGQRRVTSLNQLYGYIGSTAQYRTTSFAYNDTAHTTEVTDPMLGVTTYTYDTGNRLTKVESPALAGGFRNTVEYTYDAKDNVTQVKTLVATGVNQVIDYGYDASGNLILTRDSLGNTVTRTYNSADQIDSETVYLTPDPDGSGSGQPSNGLTTHYIYDVEQHLRYVISPEGRVTQHTYFNNSHNRNGLRSSTLTYGGANQLYTGSTYTEAAMTTWLSSTDLANKSFGERTDYTYDALGQLLTSTVYTSLSNSGGSNGSGSVVTTSYVYGRSGELLQKIPLHPNTTSTTTVTYTYTYDGLGRLLTATDPMGRVSASSYDDANNRIVLTAGGVTTTSVYNAAGDLTSLTQAGGSLAMVTSNFYDANGRLRMTTDANGNSVHYIYDAAGQLVGQVDAEGDLTETRYDGAGRVVSTLRYDVPVAASQLISAGQPVSTTLADLITSLGTVDPRANHYIYDAAGRLAFSLVEDAYNAIRVGSVNQRTYDGAGRLVKETAYTQRIATAVSLTFNALTAAVSGFQADADNRTARYFYTSDGLLQATLDAEGYLSENIYDPAGRLTQTIRYATATNTAQRASGTLADLRPATDAKDQAEYFFYDARGKKIGSIDAEGYFTYSLYTRAGLLREERRYAHAVSYSAGLVMADYITQGLADVSTGQTVRAEVKSYTYDALGRLATTTQSTLNGTATSTSSVVVVSTLSEYDTVTGFLIRVTTGSDITTLTGTERRITEYRYDALGRLLQEVGGEGGEVIRLARASTTDPQSVIDANVDTAFLEYGSRHEYDAAGRRIKTTEASGKITLYYYDKQGRLTWLVTSASNAAEGEVTGTTYNTFGDILSVKQYVNRVSMSGLTAGGAAPAPTADAAKDRVISNSYFKTGLVKKFTDAEAFNTQFTYNAFGEVATQVLDVILDINTASTRTDTFTYDHRGLRKVGVVDAGSGKLQLTETNEYDAFGRLTKKTDPLGGEWKTSYDRIGRVVTTEDALHQSATIAYDAFSQVLTQTDRNGATTSYAYTTASGRRTVTTTTPEGVVTQTLYDRYGSKVRINMTNGSATETTTWGYDRNGRLKTFVVDNVSGGLQLTTTNTYSKAGLLTAVVDAKGNRVSYTYDAANRVLTRTLDPLANQATNVTSYTYNAFGETVTVTDPNGVITETTFDRKGRSVAVIFDTANLKIANTYSYDHDNRIIRAREGRAATGSTGNWTYSSGRINDFYYDRAGRRIKDRIDANGLEIINQYNYDKNGNLIRTLANGGNTRYTYDADNRLVYTVDTLGDVTQTLYDAEGAVTQLIKRSTAINVAGLPTFPTTADVFAALPSTDANASITKTVYDRDGRVVYTIDAMGAVTRNTYDAGGRITKVVQYAKVYTDSTSTREAMDLWFANGANLDAANDRVEYRFYDAAGRKAYTMDALGYVTRYTLDGDGNITKIVQYAKAYTSSLLTKADLDTWFANSANLDATNDRTEYRVYDSANQLIYQLDSLLDLVQYVYDGAGNVTKTVRYAKPATSTSKTGLDSWTATPANADANDQIEYFFYDGRNRKIGSIDAEGYFTSYTYNRLDFLTEERRYAHTVTYGAGTTMATYATLGTADNAGQTIRATIKAYARDSLGRVTTVTESLLSGTTAANATSITVTRTRNEYDAITGFLIRVTAGDDVAAPNVERRVTEYRYDAVGRLLQEVGGEGSEVIRLARAGSAPQSVIDTAFIEYGSRYEYDALGRRIKTIEASGKVTLYYYDKQGRVRYTVTSSREITTTDVPPVTYMQGEVSEVIYDAFGAATSVKQYANRINLTALTAAGTPPAPVADAARDRVVAYEYQQQGLIKKTTDAELYAVQNGYNAFGEVTSRVTDIRTALGVTGTRTDALAYDRRGLQTASTTDSISGGLQIGETREYDSFGRLTKKTDALGGQWKTTYDRLGRVVATEDALHQTTAATYDAFSRALTQTDKNAATTTYTYAIATDGRRTTTVNTAEGVVTKTTYDRYGSEVRIEFLEAGVGKEARTWTYDRDGRLKTSVLDSDSQALTSANEYNKAGQLTSAIDAAGNRVSYVYDAANRVLTRTVDPGALGALNLVTRYAYNAFGEAICVTDANGVVTDTVFDRNGNSVAVIVDTAGLKLATTYAYDQDGRTLRIVEGAQASGSTGSWTITGGVRTTDYTYDRAGRRIQQVVDPGALAIATNYTYDKNDNLVRRDIGGSAWRYTYDANGQQVYEVDPVGNVTQKLYDADGNVTQVIRRSTPINVAGLPAVVSSADVLAALPATDTAAAITKTVYDRDGRVVYAIDAIGAAARSFYDAAGNVKMVIQYAKPYTGATFTKTALDTWFANGLNLDSTNDRVSNRVYDGARRPVYSVDALGGVTRSYYDGAGNLTVMVQYAKPYGSSTFTKSALDTWFANGVNLDSANDRTSYRTYDNAGRLAYMVDALRGVTRNVYDADGNLAKVIQYAKPYTASTFTTAALDTWFANSANQDSVNDRTSYSFYDNAGRLVYALDAMLDLVQNVYDAAGNVVKIVRYSNRVTTAPLAKADIDSWIATPTNPDSSNDRVINHVYDAAGHLRFTIDPRGAVVENRYDALDRLVQTVQYGKFLNVAGLSSAPTESEVITALGGAVAFDRFSSGLSQYALTGSGITSDGRMVLTNGAAVSTARSSRDYAISAAQPRTFRYEVTTATQTGDYTIGIDSSAGGTLKMGARFDSSGFVRFYAEEGSTIHSQIIGAYAANTTYVVEVEVTTTQATLYVYRKGDGRSAGVNWIQPMSWTQARAFVQAETGSGQQAYVDNLAETPSRDDQITTNVYDAAGRLLSVVDAEGYTESYTYDAFGQKTSHTNQNGQTWSYAYDAAGRMTQETSPYVNIDRVNPSVAADGLNGAIESAVSADNKNVYVIGADGNTITVFERGAGNTLKWVQTLTSGGVDDLGATVQGMQVPSSVAVSPDGKLVCVVSTGDDKMTVFKRDTATGRLTFSQKFDDVNIPFPQNIQPLADATCVVFSLDSKNIYVASPTRGRVGAYTVNATTSAVTFLNSAVAAGANTLHVGVGYVYALGGSEAVRLDRNTSTGALTVSFAGNPDVNVVLNGMTDITVVAAGGFAYSVNPTKNAIYQWTVGADKSLTGVSDVYAVSTSGFGGFPFGTTITQVNGLEGVSSVAISSDGSTLYATSPTNNNILIFSRNLTNGDLTFVDTVKGTAPNGGNALLAADGLSLSADGRYLYALGSGSDAMVTYAIGAGGLLTQIQTLVQGDSGYAIQSEENQILTIMSYDAFGNLLSRQEQGVLSYGPDDQRTTTYLYDKLGRQVSTTNPDSTYTNVVYDTLGNAVRARDVGGKYSYKVYDAAGRLAYEVDADLYATKYGYDAFGNVTSTTRYNQAISDPAGTILTMTGIASRLTPSTAYDRSITMEFDRVDRQTRVIKPVVYSYDAVLDTARADAPTTTFDYNAFSELVQQHELRSVSAGGSQSWDTTYYYYDLSGNRKAKVDAVSLDGNMGYLTEWTYSTTGKLLSSKEWEHPLGYNATLQAGRWNESGYIAQARVSASTVGSIDPLLYASNFASSSAVAQDFTGIPSANFVLQGGSLQVKDANGSGTLVRAESTATYSGAQNYTFIYNYTLGTGTSTAGRRYIGIGNWDGGALTSSTFGYYLSIDANNLVSTYRIDGTKAYEGTRFTINADVPNHVRFDVDERGVKLSVYGGDQGSTNGYTYRFDTTNGIGDFKLQMLAGTTTVTQRALTISSIVVARADYYSATEADLQGRVNANVRETAYEYDHLGRQVASKDVGVISTALGTGSIAVSSVSDNITRTSYDGVGNTVAKADAMGAVTRSYYDALGRLVATVGPSHVDQLIGLPGTQSIQSLTRYNYDGLGRLIAKTQYAAGALAYNDPTPKAIDASVDATTYYFNDLMGRTLYEIDAEGGGVAYEYDAYGNLTHSEQSFLRADGSVGYKAENHTYNGRGMETSESERLESGNYATMSTTYNAFGEVVGKAFSGGDAQDANFVPPLNQQNEIYRYDNNGRMIYSNRGGVSSVYLSNLKGNVTAEIQSATIDLSSTTAANLATVAGMTSGVRRTENIYDALGRITSQRQPEFSSSALKISPEFTLTSSGSVPKLKVDTRLGDINTDLLPGGWITLRMRQVGTTTWSTYSSTPSTTGAPAAPLSVTLTGKPAGNYEYQIEYSVPGASAPVVYGAASGTIVLAAQGMTGYMSPTDVIFERKTVSGLGSTLYYVITPAAGSGVSLAGMTAVEVIGSDGSSARYAVTSNGSSYIVPTAAGFNPVWFRPIGTSFNQFFSITGLNNVMFGTITNVRTQGFLAGLFQGNFPLSNLGALASQVVLDTFQYRQAGANDSTAYTTISTGSALGFPYDPINNIDGNSFSYKFRLVDGSGNPVNLSGITFPPGVVGDANGYITGTYTAWHNSFDGTISGAVPVAATEDVVPANAQTVVHAPVLSQIYDRWGNVQKSTDAAGVDTQYFYDAGNRLIRKFTSDTTTVDTRGVTRLITPTWRWAYDKAGRELLSLDANGNETLRVFNDAGEMVAQVDAMLTSEYFTYDALGRRVKSMLNNNLSYTTEYAYDRLGRLVRQKDPAKTNATVYAYDAMGNRTSENGMVSYVYDARGNVLKELRPRERDGARQQMTYVYDALGRRVQQTDANGNVIKSTFDYFGRMLTSTGMSNTSVTGGVTTYAYDYLGNKTSELLARGGKVYERYYTYYENGLLKSSFDPGTPDDGIVGTITGAKLSEYRYDVAGRLLQQRFTATPETPGDMKKPVVYQDTVYQYDSVGRVSTVYDQAAKIDYAYDAQNNHILTRIAFANLPAYNATPGGDKVYGQIYQYEFDKNNRIQNTMEARVATTAAGVVSLKDIKGSFLQFNNAGDRFVETRTALATVDVPGNSTNVSDLLETLRKAQNGVNTAQGTVSYYDASHRLVESRADFDPATYISRRTYNDLDQIVKYEEVGKTPQTYIYNADGTVYSTSGSTTDTYTYDNAGNVTHLVVSGIGYYDYAYEVRDSGKLLKSITANGNTTKEARDYDYRDNQAGTIVNNDGRIVRKNSTNGDMTLLVYQGSNLLGDWNYKVGPNGVSDSTTVVNFGLPNSLVERTPEVTPGRVVVGNGDTLESIAYNIYGDSALWYVIADANAITGNNDLAPGMVLKIPNKVVNGSNSVTTFRPYNAADYQDQITPPPLPPPPPPKKKCGGFLRVLVTIIQVVVTVVASYFLGPVAGSLIGNAVGQLAGMAAGIQDGFSWKQLGMAAITSVMPGSNLGFAAGSIGASVASAVTSNVLAQGAGIALGLQDSFSWAGVATAAVSSGFDATLEKLNPDLAKATIKAGPKEMSFGSLARTTGVQLVKGSIVRSTQIALFGGKFNFAEVAADAFGNALGNSLRDQLDLNRQISKLGEDGKKQYKWEREQGTSVEGALGQARRLDQMRLDAIFGSSKPLWQLPGLGNDVGAPAEAAADQGSVDKGPDNVQLPIDPTAGAVAPEPEVPRKHIVKPGESISGILGTSDPAKIGAFMRANGLSSSTIRPGRELILPGDDYSPADAKLGQATLNKDNARLAEIRAAQQALAESQVPAYLSLRSLNPPSVRPETPVLTPYDYGHGIDVPVSPSLLPSGSEYDYGNQYNYPARAATDSVGPYQGFWGDISAISGAYANGQVDLGSALKMAGDSVSFNQLPERAMAGVGVLASGVQTFVGFAGAFVTSETGIGAVGLGLVGLNGLDNLQASWPMFWDGEPGSTFGSKALQAAGVRPAIADVSYGVVSLFGGTIGVGKVADGLAASRMPKVADAGSNVGLPDALLPEADFLGQTPLRPADSGDLGPYLNEAFVGPMKPSNWDALTSHLDAHALSVHGGAVTDADLVARARTGLKPNGDTGPIPPLSSAFYSDALLISTDQAVREGGGLASAIARQPGESVVRVEAQDVGDLGMDLGYGYARLYKTGNLAANEAAVGPLQRIDGLSSAKGIYEFNPMTKIWETITVYPSPATK